MAAAQAQGVLQVLHVLLHLPLPLHVRLRLVLGLKGADPVLRGVQLSAGLVIALAAAGFALVQLLFPQRIPAGLLLAQGIGPGLGLVQVLAQAVGLAEGLVDLLLLMFQLGEQAGVVEAAAVLPAFQGFVRLGPGALLLPGGHQGGNPPFQLLALGDGQAALAEKNRAVKDLPPYTGEGFPQVFPGEAGDGAAAVHIHRGEIPHRDPALGGAADLNDGTAIFTEHGALHRGPVPGAVAVLVGGGPPLVPLAGIQAVEHGPEEGTPGGLAAAVGGTDEGHARAEGEGLPLEAAEGGGEFQ